MLTREEEEAIVDEYSKVRQRQKFIRTGEISSAAKLPENLGKNRSVIYKNNKTRHVLSRVDLMMRLAKQ